MPESRGETALTLENLNRMAEDVRSDSGPGSTTRAFNEELIATFRAQGGRMPGELEGSRFLLLTTTGARSGRERTTPLAYVKLDDRVLIVASKGGAPSHPAWYHNLVAHPDVTVERDGAEYRARAVVIEGDERDALYDRIARKITQFAEYQRRTPRRIPLVELVAD